MGNQEIQREELIFLRKAILERYCKLLALDAAQFENNLTGTIRYYEDMCRVIQEQLSFGTITNYYESINDSHLKFYIRKIQESVRPNHERIVHHFSTAISANQLRKLVYSSKSSEMETFKTGFIICAYIFVGVDRTTLNFDEKKPVPTNVSNTIPVKFAMGIGEAGNTHELFTNISASIQLIEIENNEEGQALVFTGDSVALNRDNLSPGNTTITSKVQAELRFNGREWQIENKSVLKSTYLQLNRPVTVYEGDVLLIGNKKYKVAF